MTTTTHDPLIGELRRNAFELCAASRHEPAQMVLKAALQIAPDDAELLSDLAGVYLHEGRNGLAIQTARAALAVDAKHDPSAYALAIALAANGETDEARFLLLELTQGLRGQALAQRFPDLHAHALVELQKLAAATVPPAEKPSTRFTAEGAAKYDLSHLRQKPAQNVGGPVQDDEALALYALVRVMRVRRVLEVGGLNGYSARNFLAALGDETDAAVYTVDLNPVKSQAPNHHVITKDCALVTAAELHGKPLELIFFDAHVVDAQLALLDRLAAAGLLRPDTVVALHDTNLHPRKTAPWSYPLEREGRVEGWVHQAAERVMVNALRQRGWDALCLHMPAERADARLPIRHGLTLMQRFQPLAT